MHTTKKSGLHETNGAAMHKRKSFRKDAERVARSTQVKLDEICYRFEQDKKRTVMLNRFERIKVWNELREIRRVFVPSYFPQAGRMAERRSSLSPQAGMVEKGSNLSESSEQPTEPNADKLKTTIGKGFEKKNLRRAQSEAVLSLRRRSTAEEKEDLANEVVSEKVYSLSTDKNDERKISIDVTTSKNNLEGGGYRQKPRSNSTPSSALEASLTHLESNSSPKETSVRPYIPLSKRVSTTPSNTMLSVSLGYQSFKRMVKDKTHTQSFISPRFRCKSDSEMNIKGHSAFLMQVAASKPTANGPNGGALTDKQLTTDKTKKEITTNTSNKVHNSAERERGASVVSLTGLNNKISRETCQETSVKRNIPSSVQDRRLSCQEFSVDQRNQEGQDNPHRMRMRSSSAPFCRGIIHTESKHQSSDNKVKQLSRGSIQEAEPSCRGKSTKTIPRRRKMGTDHGINGLKDIVNRATELEMIPEKREAYDKKETRPSCQGKKMNASPPRRKIGIDNGDKRNIPEKKEAWDDNNNKTRSLTC